jgi:hypothetical protein
MEFEQIVMSRERWRGLCSNRPKYLNAQSYQLLAEFDQALARP